MRFESTKQELDELTGEWETLTLELEEREAQFNAEV